MAPGPPRSLNVFKNCFVCLASGLKETAVVLARATSNRGSRLGRLRLGLRRRGRGGAAASLLACLALAAPAGALAQAEAAPDSTTPIAFAERSLHILHLPLLDFGPARPDAIEPGSVRWTAEAAYGNTFSTTWHARRVHDNEERRGTELSREEVDYLHEAFAQDEILFLDGELLRTALTGRFGLSRTTFVSVDVPFIVRGGFSLDGSVRDFHKTLGTGQNGRDEFPSGRLTVLLQSPGGPVTFVEKPLESGFGDVTATFSWRTRARGNGLAYGGDLAVKAPSGSAEDFNGSGGWDGGLLLFLAWKKAKWTLEADASLIVPGAWKVPVPLDPQPFARILLSVIRDLGRRSRVGLSSTFAQSPFRKRDYSTLSDPGYELALGFEYDVGPGLSARLMLLENLPNFGDRADVGLVLGLRYR